MEAGHEFISIFASSFATICGAYYASLAACIFFFFHACVELCGCEFK